MKTSNCYAYLGGYAGVFTDKKILNGIQSTPILIANFVKIIGNHSSCSCFNPYKIDPAWQAVFVYNETFLVEPHDNQVHGTAVGHRPVMTCWLYRVGAFRL